MEVWQTLEFIWDSQIEPFIEFNIGLDIINQFRADFVRGITGVRASRGYTQLPKNSFMVKFLQIKTMLLLAVVTTLLSYYEFFMQVLEALFHAFVVKNGLWLRETKPLGKLCCLALYF